MSFWNAPSFDQKARFVRGAFVLLPTLDAHALKLAPKPAPLAVRADAMTHPCTVNCEVCVASAPGPHTPTEVVPCAETPMVPVIDESPLFPYAFDDATEVETCISRSTGSPHCECGSPNCPDREPSSTTTRDPRDFYEPTEYSESDAEGAEPCAPADLLPKCGSMCCTWCYPDPADLEELWIDEALCAEPVRTRPALAQEPDVLPKRVRREYAMGTIEFERRVQRTKATAAKRVMKAEAKRRTKTRAAARDEKHE